MSNSIDKADLEARYREGKKRYHARRAERKQNIKAQNAERKTERREIEPLTPEQMEAVKLMARGLFAMIAASLPKRDELPSELDVN